LGCFELDFDKEKSSMELLLLAIPKSS